MKLKLYEKLLTKLNYETLLEYVGNSEEIPSTLKSNNFKESFCTGTSLIFLVSLMSGEEETVVLCKDQYNHQK